MTASTITIVTKNTPQSYTGGTTAAAKGTALSVFEVDSNFINLKEGIIQVEADLASTDTSIRSYINSNFIQSFSPVFTGTPTAPNPGGTGASQLQTVDAVNDLLSPITSTVNSATIGNQALANSINLKADLNSPLFTGYPRLTGTSYNFTTWDPVNQYLAPVEYVHDKLENLSGNVKPATAGGANLGTATEYFNELRVTSVLPAGDGATLGTNTNRFEFAYIEELHVGENTIFVGDAQISADGSTLVVPVNTAIGDQENVLPLNIASTTVDKRFAELSLVEPLDQTFTASGAITDRDPVAINSDGTVSTISNSVSNLNFVGIALASAANTASVSVRVHGEVSGFTGLTDGSAVFAENNGTLVQTKTSTSLKIGTAISATEIMLFTTSNLDTYLLNIKKTELSDFSATNASSASGTGGLSYNSSTGQFTFTPADTSSFATTAFVNTEIANLVNSAPTSLDTLDELAAALNDDANFASTVTNSLAAKAPLASPGLTGTPTAPTASSGTNSTQIATTAYVQSEISGLGNASLSSFSVTSNSASGGGALSYNNTSGVFTYTPPDLSSALTTETDPVVGAITGIVKADGSGNISAAVAGTDYSTFDGAFSSLTGKPTTISGYGITDAAPLASPAFTGTPTAPTAGGGTSTTQIATTAFVQNAVTAGSGIQLTDLSVSTNTASGQGALGYNSTTGQFTFTPTDTSGFGNASLNSFSVSTTSASGAGSLAYNTANGVFSFTPADLSFGNISGTPTTVAGYGITDAAPLASPTFTGTPAAPTAASGTNTTQIATTAFVQGEISGFSSTGGDSQRDYTASGAITGQEAVVLNTNGTVSNVSVVTAGINTATRPLHDSTNNAYNHSGVDWNETDSVYHHAYRNNTTLYIKAESPNLSALTLTQSVITTTSLGGTANSKLIYKHVDGTSTGILVYNVSGTYYAKYVTYDSTTPTHNIGSNTYTLPSEPFDVVIKDSGRMFILYSDRVDSIAINTSAKTFSLTDNTTVGVSSTSASPMRLFWDATQSTLITFRNAGSTNQYQYISESSGNLTASSVVTASNTTDFHQIEYHPGLGTYFGFRWAYSRVGSEDRYYPNFTPLTVGGSSVTYGSEVQASIYLSQYDAYNQHSGSGDMRFVPAKTGNGVSIYHLMRIAASGAASQGRESFAFGTLNSSGTYTNSANFTPMIGVNNGNQAGTSAHAFGTSIDKDGYAYISYPISYGNNGNTTRIASTLIRTSAVSNANEYLGIAQSSVSDGSTVTVMLAGGVSTGHSSLTQDTKYYVQNDGSLSTTASSVLAGHSVSTNAIQVADSKGVFDQTVAFADLTSTPTTVAGYGITDAASTTYVNTQINNLIDSAPGALDTLNELAAALGDDANFSTTVTNNLALKAPLADPALTGTPTAPTATSGNNTTQIATTAYVQSEIAGFSTSGGDSQKSYTSGSAITQGDAVVLDTAGTVSSVAVSSAAVGTVATFQSSTANQTSIGYDDYNSKYYYFFRSGSEIKVDILTPDFANLTTTTGSETTLVQGVAAGAIVKYVHLTGTTQGVLVYYTSTGYQLRVVSQSSGTWTVNTATTISSGDVVRDMTLGPNNTPLLLIEDSNGDIQVAALSISGTAITIGTYDEITGFTSAPSDIFYVQNKIVVADPVSTTVEYATGTISGTTISMNSSLSVSTQYTYGNIYYHGGSGLFVLDRIRAFGDINPQRQIHIKPLSFNGTTLTALNDIDTNWVAGRNINSRHWQFSSSGTGLAVYAVYQTYQSYTLYNGLGTLTSSGTFTRSSGLTSFSSGTSTNPGAHESRAGYGMFLINGTKGTLVRLDSISNSDSWLGIAQSTVTSGNSVNVTLAGGIANVYSGLTLNADYYVQDDGTVSSTASDVFAGVAVAATALQVTDTKNTFRKTTSFSDLSNTPTTLSGYGISGDVDIGSSDFITTGKAYYANVFSTTSDLPSPSTYHGMFAHVHATGAGYFAHAGNWIELANKSYVDTQVANIINSAPGALDTLDELAAALNDDANFATTVTTSLAAKAPLAGPALTGTPTAPTASSGTNTTQIATTAFVQQEVTAAGSYNNASVDTHLNRSTASTGEVLSWNGTDYDWIAQAAGGGASVTISDAAPSSPSAGDLWFDSTGLALYVYYNDGDSSQWVQTNPSGSSSSGSGATPWAEKTSAYSALAGDRLIVDTSNAVTVTLPSVANLGDEIRIIDGTGNAATNNITIARNGHKIEGDASNLIIDVDRAAFGLVYYNTAQGWVMTER